jgi:hypothetical protein
MRRRSVSGIILGLCLTAGLQGSASAKPPAGYLSSLTWNGEDDRFGGFSAIELDAEGLGFVALSDHGAFVQGRLQRDAEGLLTGVTAGPLTLLKGKGEAPLANGRTDSEGLAIAPDGTVFISFEGPARVLRYDQLGGSAVNLPTPREFEGMKHNSALEALAIGPDGSLYTLAEDPGPVGRPAPVYRFKDGAWTGFGTIRHGDDFLSVAADVGPDGRFYLLQREFAGLAGFASRLLRYDIGEAGLTGRTVLFQTDLGTHDDLEGLSVWRDAAGHLRATMVSDNNFSVFFTTEIVEYRLAD